MKNFSFSKKLLLRAGCLFAGMFCSFAALADDGKSWSMSFENSKAFIENKGQFHTGDANEQVLYAYDNGGTMIYFTAKGVSYSFIKCWKKEKGDEKEKAREKYYEQMRGFKSAEDFLEHEKEERRMEVRSDRISFYWENANVNSKVEVSEPTSEYFSYTFKDNDGNWKNENFISGFKKLTYKNIYPNIDVEYTFHPQEGIKYALILNPGADISQVKMHYGDNVKLLDNGDLHIHTKFGDIIDHAPISFYAKDKSEVIASHFVKDGKTISFQLANYDHTKTLVVDPWTQTPTFTASNGVWECEKDAGGNAYIIGGETPMRLKKYSSAGALVWTFTTAYDTSSGEWLGSMATDLAGNSYVTNGSSARMTKVNSAGTQVWAVTGGGFDEYWTIAFNCDQTKLIVGGTRIVGAPNGYIFDINTSNGSVNTAVKVGSKRTYTIFGFPVTDGEEVRSITSSRNARYYFLTLDSIGTIDQNFSACSTPVPLWAVNHGYSFGYKCETNRPNNGNGAIVAIRANKNFVYTQNGVTVHKRALATGAILASAAIPGGISVASGGMNQAGNCGIDLDSCGNVYVGSGNAIVKYDANLNQLSSTALSFRVSDVAVSYGGNVLVCGTNNDNSNTARTGYIQQVNMGACDAPVLFCCDATVCPAGPYCLTHAPVTLNPVTPGGTWSGVGITNASTGVFSPAVAGVGTHTIIYTLPCGIDSISIKVNNCGSLVACKEANGNITISTGTGPFTWYHQVTTATCVTGFANCNGPFTAAGPTTTTWTSFATGTTITPGASYPIYVINTNHDSLYITSLASLPSCVSCPSLTVTPSGQVNATCAGQATGSFNASTAGGASPYDYTLVNAGGTVATFNNVAGSQAFAGLAAGTYTLNVLDNSGCPGSVVVTITQPVALSVSITASTNPSCSGANGSATAQASNGTSPYDYVWTGSAGTLQTTNNITVANTLSGLSAGTYTVTITDNNNCTTSTTVTLINAAAPAVSISAQTNVLCFGASTGNATATASSGSSPYDYVWTGSAGTLQTTNNITVPNTLNGLAAGTYTVTVTDNNNCIATQTVIITQPAVALAVAITSSTDASCGSTNGSATAQASNGTSPYDYVWTGPSGTLQTTNNIPGSDVLNNLGAGTFTVSVTDNNNCTASVTVSINNTGGPSLSITAQTNVNCNGGSTGSATVSASGGSSPYDYVWANAGGTIQTDNNLAGASTSSGLAAGTYTVSVTDNTGCISSQLVTITEPAALSAVMSSTPAGCTANGTATATVSGGTGSYTYAWSPSGGSGSTANLLASGNYTVTITDALSCTLTDSVAVGNTGGGLTATVVTTNVSCSGGSNGSAILSPTSGTSPYSYSWSTTPGQISATATNLSAGTYTCTFTDANLCVGTQTVTITEPAALSIVPAQTNVQCVGASTGSATVTVSGGTVPYTYSWAPAGGSANSATGLASGNYTCTITDINSCQATQSFAITDLNPAITATITSTPSSCSQSNGTASVTAGGGV
ncbi:MAG: beta strand repeat-containing protein, partial [Bacteroidia bacterium]